MEMKIVIAALVGAVTLVVGAYLLLRNARERRKFRLRQQGRGKNVAVMPVE